jgi:transcriptional regulator with XRE-family HTH domain
MTILSLAGRVGVERHAIAAYEAGEYAPQPQRLRRIAQVLNFPRPILLRSRARRHTAARDQLTRAVAAERPRDMALGSAALAIALNQWIARHVHRRESAR